MKKTYKGRSLTFLPGDVECRSKDDSRYVEYYFKVNKKKKKVRDAIII